MKNCSEEDAIFLAGPIGDKLKRFADLIDLDNPHPDLLMIADGLLTEDCPDSYSQLLCDIINLSCHMSQREWHHSIISAMRNIVVSATDNCVLKSIGNPGVDLLNIRFIKNRSDRDALRSKKIPQVIRMSALLGKKYWDNIPSNFRNYWRGINSFAEDIEKSEIRHKHFSDIGLEFMAKEVQSSIDVMRQKAYLTQYYNFNRISLQTTAAIVAKICGINVHRSSYESSIYVHADSFPGFNFYDSVQKYHSRIECSMFCKPLVRYEVIPEPIKEVVDFLEEFPEASGHPLFDNYWVVCPSINYPVIGFGSYYSFINTQGQRVEFERMQDAQQALLQELLNNHYFVAAVLGERDGEYYFLCHWIQK